MTKLKYGSLIVDASGKIPGGVLTSGGGFRKVPTRPNHVIGNTSSFARQMNYMFTIKSTWSIMSVAQKLTWANNSYVKKSNPNTHGPQKNNPWLLFQAWSMSLLLIGQPLNTSFITPVLSNYTPPPIPNWTLSGNVWTMPNSLFCASYTWLVVQASKVYSVSQSPRSTNYKFIFRVPGGRFSVQHLDTMYLYWLTAPTSVGQHFYCRYRFIDANSGYSTAWFYQTINVV